MDKLNRRAELFFQKHCKHRNVLVAYSGGVDSLVLLQLAKNYLHGNITAIHINHGVQDQAALWETHCRKVTDALEIPLITEHAGFAALPDTDPENTLREARHALYSRHMGSDDILLTAHHQDDQAETVLLQLLRGAGPRGLSAMPAIKKFGNGWHGRPLLFATRAEIHEYAVMHQLVWMEDPSNTDTRFTRNWLRHEILPQLENRLKNTTVVLARVADNCAASENLLDEFLSAEVLACRGLTPATLSVTKLLERPETLQAGILRAWLKAAPPRKKLQQIQKDMLHAGEDRAPHAFIGDWEMRRYRDDLYFMQRLLPHDATQIIPWDAKTPLEISGAGILQPFEFSETFVSCADPVTVRFRIGGEILYDPKRGQHQCLKKIFQQKGIPPWQRDRMPLIYKGEKLAGLGQVTNGCERSLW